MSYRLSVSTIGDRSCDMLRHATGRFDFSMWVGFRGLEGERGGGHRRVVCVGEKGGRRVIEG